MAYADYVEIIRLLLRHDVEFIVVGMAAAILQGTPGVTLDLDIVHRRTPENVEKLLIVLEEIRAVARHGDRKLKAKASHLIGPGQILLDSDKGHFDCLGHIDNDKTYDDLLPNTAFVPLDDGTLVRVLDLATLIDFKRRAGRPKDKAVMHLLKATLDEIRKQAAK